MVGSAVPRLLCSGGDPSSAVIQVKSDSEYTDLCNHRSMKNPNQMIPVGGMQNQSANEREEDITANSSLIAMHSAHSRLSRALGEVDRMMVVAHRLFCIDQMSAHEAKHFTLFMTQMSEQFEAWDSFFKDADEKSRALQHDHALIELGVEPRPPAKEDDDLQGNSSFISGSPLVPCKSRAAPAPLFPLTPLSRPSENCKRKSKSVPFEHVKPPLQTRFSSGVALDSGPIKVNPDLLHPVLSSHRISGFQEVKPMTVNPATSSPATPASEKEVTAFGLPTISSSDPDSGPIKMNPDLLHPVLSSHRISGSQEVKPLTVNTATSSPATPASEKEVTAFGLPTISSSDPDSSPPQDCYPYLESPESMELVTPVQPDFQRRQAARANVEAGSISAFDCSDMSVITPESESPARIRRPLRSIDSNSLDTNDQSDVITPKNTRTGIATPGMGTPYGTPDSSFRPLTPFSISRTSSAPLVDDITASAIQRMGVKGLEDELWKKMKAWHIDTHLGGPYARLRPASAIPLPKLGSDPEHQHP